MTSLIPNITHKQYLFFIRHFISVLVFAILYYIAYHYIEHAYDKDKSHQLSFFEFLYFSLTTQTTIGYGDIIPTHYITKAIAALQLITVISIIILTVV